MDEELERDWRALSEEVLAGVKEWRAAHPKATFQELERAIHERMSRLEARILHKAAQDRTASDWAHAPERDHPRCPSGGTPLLARGQHVRHEAATRRAGDTSLEQLWNWPDVWSRAFPPSMKREHACQGV